MAARSEPVPISPSVNAHIVAGFVNWDRVRGHQAAWLAEHGPLGAAGWPREMQRVVREERWRFHDRFILVCARAYSATSASELGLTCGEADWLEQSIVLRYEHEFMHYATLRLYGKMKWLGIAMFLAWTYNWLTAATSYYVRTVPPNLQHEPPVFLLPYELMGLQLALPFFLGGVVSALILWRAIGLERAKVAK